MYLLRIESRVSRGTCTSTAVLFTIAKRWKRHKCPLMDEWLNKTWYGYIQWNTMWP